MSASEDRELHHEAAFATLGRDDVAQRTFWVTLAAGIVAIAITSLVTPPPGPTRKSATDQSRIAARRPAPGLIARNAVAAQTPAPATRPPADAISIAATAVEPLPIEPTEYVTQPAAPAEIAHTIQIQAETLPDPVTLPEETTPAPLIAQVLVESQPAPVAETVAPPASTAGTETAATPPSADDDDVKVASVDAVEQGTGIEPRLKTTAETVVRFRGRWYTLTCPHCGGHQSESADCIADHRSFRCLSCTAKIKVRELHQRLEDEQKQLRKLARR